MSGPTAEAALHELAEEFALLDDWEDRYRYIIDLGQFVQRRFGRRSTHGGHLGAPGSRRNAQGRGRLGVRAVMMQSASGRFGFVHSFGPQRVARRASTL